MDEKMTVKELREWLKEAIRKEAGLSILVTDIGDDTIELELGNDQTFTLLILDESD